MEVGDSAQVGHVLLVRVDLHLQGDDLLLELVVREALLGKLRRPLVVVEAAHDGLLRVAGFPLQLDRDLKGLLVRPLLHLDALVEHDDRVGILDGRQPVGDREGRVALHHAVERVLHRPLVDGVERRRRLVEEQSEVSSKS